MDRKTYAICGVIIAMTLGGVIGFSITIENVILPIVAVTVGMALLYLCKSRVKEVIEDERTHRISERASRKTFQIFTPSVALIGVILIAWRNKYPNLAQSGFTLAYSVCALLMLYNIFYMYYNKKYGD